MRRPRLVTAARDRVRTPRHAAATNEAGTAGLSVAGLVTGYLRAPILHGVDLRVGPGEAVGLLGANGAGKTTLLRAISGGLRCWRGRVSLDEHEIGGLPSWRRVRLGVAHVLEGRRTFSAMTVRENLAVAGLVAGRRQTDFDVVFAMFPRLFERQAQRAGSMSGGEQQMLAIGRALMTRPRLLLVDEMSAGLAPVVTRELVAGLRRVNQAGVALLVVEQSPHVLVDLVDRMYLLEDGRMVREGTTEGVGDPDAMAQVYLGVHRAAGGAGP